MTSLIPPPRTSFPVPPFKRLTMEIFAKPGSGKTKFLGGSPNTLFLATEPGQDFVKGSVVDINDWPKFCAVVKELAESKKAGKLEYESFVVDIVDNLHGMARDYVCAMKKIKYPPKDDFGKTWSEITTMWSKWLGSLMRVGNVHFVSHATVETVDVENDQGILEEIQRVKPTFYGNKAAQYLDGVINAMGFISVTGTGQRVITFRQTARIGAKDRTEILEKLGVIPLPETPGDGFQTVADAYASKAKELGYTLLD